MKRVLIVLMLLAAPALAEAQVCGPITVWGANPGDTVSFRWTLDRAPSSGFEQIVSDGGQPQFTLLAGSCGSCNMSFQTSISNPSVWTIGPSEARCHFDNVTFTPANNFNQTSWPVDEEGKALYREKAADWDTTGSLARDAATAWGVAALGFPPFAKFAVLFGVISASAPHFRDHYNELAQDPDDYDYCTAAYQQPQSADVLGLSYSDYWVSNGLVDETISIESYLRAAYDSANKMNTAARYQSGCFTDRQNDTAWFIYAAGYEIENYAWYMKVAADDINGEAGDNGYADYLRGRADQLWTEGEQMKAR